MGLLTLTRRDLSAGAQAAACSHVAANVARCSPQVGDGTHVLATVADEETLLAAWQTIDDLHLDGCGLPDGSPVASPCAFVEPDLCGEVTAVAVACDLTSTALRRLRRRLTWQLLDGRCARPDANERERALRSAERAVPGVGLTALADALRLHPPADMGALTAARQQLWRPADPLGCCALPDPMCTCAAPAAPDAARTAAPPAPPRSIR